MNHSYPVYTIEAECQDCYKCVRHCPVKAIRVRDGHAAVIPELCVACGKCVEVCPVKAKQVRNDTGRARLLLQDSSPVYASLAPSWVSEFRDLEPGKLIRALKLLGSPVSAKPRSAPSSSPHGWRRRSMPEPADCCSRRPVRRRWISSVATSRTSLPPSRRSVRR